MLVVEFFLNILLSVVRFVMLMVFCWFVVKSISACSFLVYVFCSISEWCMSGWWVIVMCGVVLLVIWVRLVFCMCFLV